MSDENKIASAHIHPEQASLAEVLEQIAEIEERPGYEGRQIGIMLSQLVTSDMYMDWKEDIIVGEIGRACFDIGWGFNPSISTLGQFRAIIWVRGPRIISEKHYASGESIDIAAASAYRDALLEATR